MHQSIVWMQQIRNRMGLMQMIVKIMSILYYPRSSQKTNLFFVFYSNSQISIRCFGFRPDHMVSDVKLVGMYGLAETPYTWSC